MDTKTNLKNLVAIMLLLLSYSISAQNETGWKELIIKAKEKEIEKIKTLSFDKKAIESGEKTMEMNAIFYFKSHFIEIDQKYHLVIPFYVSDNKVTTLLLKGNLLEKFVSWTIINKNGKTVDHSYRVLKKCKAVKVKFWTRINGSVNGSLKENTTLIFQGGNEDLKQELLQGRTNYLVFTKNLEQFNSTRDKLNFMPYGVYLSNKEDDYYNLMQFFKKSE